MAKKKAASKSLADVISSVDKDLTVPANSATAIAKEAIKQMPSELVPVSQEVGKLLNKYSSEELLTLYSVGELAAKVVDDPEKYGDEAITQLERANALTPGRLKHLYAFVTQFTRKDIETVVNKNAQLLADNPEFGRVSFSHFREIGRLASETRRLKLIERVIRENISVKSLRELVDSMLKSGNIEAGVNSHKVRPAVIGKKMCQNLGKVLKSFEELANDELYERIHTIVPGDISKVDTTYREARDLLNEVSTTINDVRHRLDGAIDEITTCIDNIVEQDGALPQPRKKQDSKAAKKKATKKASKKASKKVLKKKTATPTPTKKKAVKKKAAKKKATKKKATKKKAASK